MTEVRVPRRIDKGPPVIYYVPREYDVCSRVRLHDWDIEFLSPEEVKHRMINLLMLTVHTMTREQAQEKVNEFIANRGSL